MAPLNRRPRLTRLHGLVKPRVLLVDDHRGILKSISAMLADTCEIVGLATDGNQAIDSATRLSPDLIVLDINMPGMNGFETIRALRQAGSRAPAVFLSTSEDDDHVREAFRCGGRGYVLKSRVVRDLPTALDQALLGRIFVPSLTSLFELAGGGHAMQLHGELQRFLDGIAQFFDRALQRGDATCVIATGEVREGLARRLRDAGWDVDGASGHPRYLAVDAADAINRFMRDGLPDPRVLAEIASELDQYRRAVTSSASSRLTVFGNMVVPLITGGNAAAAIAVEHQWHQLTEGLPFFTLCAYSNACFHDAAPDLWSRVCHEHWAVSQTIDA